MQARDVLALKKREKGVGSAFKKDMQLVDNEVKDRQQVTCDV
jgi:hypothetical protein